MTKLQTEIKLHFVHRERRIVSHFILISLMDLNLKLHLSFSYKKQYM